MGGVVFAPSGMLAKSGPHRLFELFASLFGFPAEAVAQVHSLAPVQNARVFLVNVDNSGQPVGTPLAVSTTDANGIFIFDLPRGTNLSLSASTLTVIQAAVGGASSPVAIGTPGVLNVPAAQQIMVVDPAGELGTRRIITAGIGNFSSAAAAGYVGLIQALLHGTPSLVGSSISSTISNLIGDPGFQNDVLPVLLDIEQSAQVSQNLIEGGYQLFSYYTYPIQTTEPFRRTTEHGDLTFDPSAGTMMVNSFEFGGKLREQCTTTCTRTFTLESFSDGDSGEGLFFRTGTNRIVFSTPGGLSFVGQVNPTGTVGMFSQRFRGNHGLGVFLKEGTNISGSDFAATFNYVNFGSILNQASVNQPMVSGTTWTGVLQSRSGAGTLILVGGNSPVGFLGATNGESTMGQQVTCTLSGPGCSINASLQTLPPSGFPHIGIPFTVISDGQIVLAGIGKGGMSSDRTLYAATEADPLHPQDISFSVMFRQTSAMTPGALNGTYRVITLQDDLTTTARVITQLQTGTAQFDGVNSSLFTVQASLVDRIEECSTGTCAINTVITPISAPANEARTYSVTPTGTLAFTGSTLPPAATVSGAVTTDASFFVVQMQSDNVGGTSTRSITLGVKEP
jgi:hypothetical protein